jgi:Domain of unknown function (DUF4304)
MITAADFKKQIAKPFGQEMRLHGFKGTGFEYKQETNDYLIAVYIDPSRWGGSCSAGFAIHPKLIDKDYNGKKDLAKLKTYQYEFKFGLTTYARGESWEYADDETTNLATLFKILDAIKTKAFPVIDKFKATPNILDQFEVSEMNKFHDNLTKRLGTSIATTDLRFAWAMTIIFENKNLEKARQFAKWALSQPDNLNSNWFGNKDFHRVLTNNNGA